MYSARKSSILYLSCSAAVGPRYILPISLEKQEKTTSQQRQIDARQHAAANVPLPFHTKSEIAAGSQRAVDILDPLVGGIERRSLHGEIVSHPVPDSQVCMRAECVENTDFIHHQV